MPQIIIHIASSMREGERTALVREAREAVTTVLKLDTIIGQVILYESPVEYRGVHDERSPHFVFVEIFMYPGRSRETKKELVDRLLFLAGKYAGLDENNCLAVIHEIPRENYYGGMMKKH